MTRRDINFNDILFDVLGYRGADDERVSIGFKPQGRGFQALTVSASEASEKAFGFLNYSDHPDSDVYFSINSLRDGIEPGRRGEEADVVWWRALYADFDVKPKAFSSIDDALACITTVSGMLGARPSALIFSGHGVQPIWPIEDGLLDTAEKRMRAWRLSREFGKLVEMVAWRDHRAGVDPVFDLSRVLRAPNTFNYKVPRRIVEAYAVADTGAPVTLDQVEEVVQGWGDDLAAYADQLGLTRQRHAGRGSPTAHRAGLAPALAKLLDRKNRLGLLRKVREEGDGNRNNMLLWAACRAVEDGMLVEEGDEMWDELATAAGDCGLGSTETDRTLRSALGRAVREERR
jgi:hypothetical protein